MKKKDQLDASQNEDRKSPQNTTSNDESMMTYEGKSSKSWSRFGFLKKLKLPIKKSKTKL